MPYCMQSDAVPDHVTQLTIYDDATGKRVATVFDKDAGEIMLAAINADAAAKAPADPNERVWACPVCKSTNVHSQAWVDPNTNAVHDDTERYHWCCACEDRGRNGEIGYNQGLLRIPRKETSDAYEGIMLDAANHVSLALAGTLTLTRSTLDWFDCDDMLSAGKEWLGDDHEAVVALQTAIAKFESLTSEDAE